MFNTTVATILTSVILTTNVAFLSPASNQVQIASQEINLKERTPGGGYMSDVMADNILLTLAYLNEDQMDARNIKWDEIRRPRTIEFKLNPGETFAFQEDFLSEYEGKVVKTTRARFNFEQGFKHDGYLMGDGVCHLASLINWTSQDAGLTVEARVNHDFMSIPGIDKKYGTSIYYMPGSKEANARQNLYITNTLDSAVIFRFIVTDTKLETKVLKIN